VPIIKQIFGKVEYPDKNNGHDGTQQTEYHIDREFAEVVETNPDVDDVKTFALPEGYETRQDAEYVMDREILLITESEQLEEQREGKGEQTCTE